MQVFLHQSFPSVLVPPWTCIAPSSVQQNLFCLQAFVLWCWRTEYFTPNSPHPLLRKENTKNGEVLGELTVTDSQLYLKWAPEQLLLKGLPLGPPKHLFCPNHRRACPNRALLNVMEDKERWGLIHTLLVIKGDCCLGEKKRKPGTAQLFPLFLSHCFLFTTQAAGSW